MNEIWKDVPNYEGLYKVSNLGRIFGQQGYVLTPALMLDYPTVCLRKNNKQKNIKVHRLVLLAFVGPSNLVVNHIDGNKLNNNLNNLEYCTVQENAQHAYRMGLSQGVKGEKSHYAKLTDQEVIEIRSLLGIKTQKEIGKIYGVNQQAISKIKKRTTWSHI